MYIYHGQLIYTIIRNAENISFDMVSFFLFPRHLRSIFTAFMSTKYLQRTHINTHFFLKKKASYSIVGTLKKRTFLRMNSRAFNS